MILWLHGGPHEGTSVTVPDDPPPLEFRVPRLEGIAVTSWSAKDAVPINTPRLTWKMARPQYEKVMWMHAYWKELR